MKSKITTYLLLAAVLIIWGVIVWKLFVPARMETFPLPAILKAVSNERSDVLRLDYPDPFLKRQERVSAPTHTTEVSLNMQPLEKIREECPIAYIGYMRQGGDTSCIVRLNGVHHSITIGEVVSGFLLARIYPDSLIFKKDGFSHTIYLTR